MTKKKNTTKTATAHEVKPEIHGESDLPEEKATDAETFKRETGFNLSELGFKKTKRQRKIDVLRIRKRNTKISLLDSESGKKFIRDVRKEIKKSEIENNTEWFIIWEIIDE